MDHLRDKTRDKGDNGALPNLYIAGPQPRGLQAEMALMALGYYSTF
jgi:hypothetical protein